MNKPIMRYTLEVTHNMPPTCGSRCKLLAVPAPCLCSTLMNSNPLKAHKNLQLFSGIPVRFIRKINYMGD